ncbi:MULTISPECIES: PepSY domain-containing protein [Enterococcus]|uniref:PepSY domain-containing protein n=1 Tax=Enterococcus TaxID=1350 RepID=UPI0013E921A3|nr:PepSY domain-containing protein [Enterococcus faecalis]MBP4091006.1 PepSY domain-containing protein [Enterococcus faecalis]MBP4102814.1 PepSY domain-containing protein [Enterococcus faecalis]NSV54165.1 PepSY domain-containing protein [Enterococcus faecalis]NSV83735.1 PepSY domain-containing protein [Enterococcus faecalis]HEL7528090.1 PepSY domain-containing protein [Enterococcus faecalis]
MIKEKEGCFMKKILLGSSVILALLLTAGCTAKTPTTEPTKNEQKVTTTSKKKTAVAVSLEKVTTAFEKKYPEAKLTSLQLDTDFGRYFYEIEGVDQQKEYQVEVNAETGEFTKEKVETLDADEQNGVKMQEEALDLTNIISREQATTLAEKAAKVGQATDWKLEKELGITYWEVKVKEGQQKIEVKIDAHSGKILTTERDD